jgi:hypothetical protein
LNSRFDNNAETEGDCNMRDETKSLVGASAELITPEERGAYMLRRDALVAANKRLLGTGARADEVVREAQLHFEARVRFLTEGRGR